jgi:hypothetical protein
MRYLIMRPLLWYLRNQNYLWNFFKVLQLYRSYLWWKFRRRQLKHFRWKNLVANVKKRCICRYNKNNIRNSFTFRWNRESTLERNFSTEIFRYYSCQLTATYVINEACLLLILDDLCIDKLFSIASLHETIFREIFYPLVQRKTLTRLNSDYIFIRFFL